MKDERAHLQLFDLIARTWQLSSPVQQITFNADDTAVAFASEDGSVHLAATADKASPAQRTRRAVDTGRLTILPRDKPYLAPKAADFAEGRSTDVVPLGAGNFAFAKDSGRINQLSPGGIAFHIAAKAAGKITSLAVSPDGKTVAHATGAQVGITPITADTPRVIRLAHPVTALAFSPDGMVLAVAHAGGIARLSVAQPDDAPADTAVDGTPHSLVWRSDGAWLAGAMAEDGFCLVDIAQNHASTRGNFPSPVRHVAFGLPTNTVVASGAFRVAAWDLADGQGVLTGKPGLVLVNAIAASPNRNLVATGYANGLLSLAEIGQPAEILLREDTGAGITAMAWSANGSYLALAGTDGSAALVEFPDSMFKS